MSKNTRLWVTNPEQVDMEVIREAAIVLTEGGTVAFPTETVYGLGANALDAEAVHGIFAAKSRPADNPLIVHVASRADVAALVSDIPPAAEILMERFWPGPLTLIMPKGSAVPYVTTGGLDSVAVRMPAHQVAIELIQTSRLPIAAPSANLSKRPSPTTAAHVAEDLWGRIDGIIDGGATGVGVESTVLDITGKVPTVLRPGGITVEQLSLVLSNVAVDPNALGQASIGDKPVKSPGMKYTHYAPRAQAVLIEGDAHKIAASVRTIVEKYQTEGHTVGVMGTTENVGQYQANVVKDMGSRKHPDEIAAKIYDILRFFDTTDVDRIVIEGIPTEGIGLAVMNRLRKAAGHNIYPAE